MNNKDFEIVEYIPWKDLERFKIRLNNDVKLKKGDVYFADVGMKIVVERVYLFNFWRAVFRFLHIPFKWRNTVKVRILGDS